MYAGVGTGVKGTNASETGKDMQIERNKEKNGDKGSLFPSLAEYQIDHNMTNFQKLCFEISEFCQAVYASTRNEEERKVFSKMIQSIQK